MYDIFAGLVVGGAGPVGTRPHAPKDRALPKDGVVEKLMPARISECALYLGRDPGAPCMDDKSTKHVVEALGVSPSPSKTAAELIDEAKSKTGCTTEKCVVDRAAPTIGEQAKDIATIYFKVKGPTDAALLSNVHIDKVMKQWSLAWPEFFPYNFNMRNYADYSYHNGYIKNQPDTLATIQFTDLLSGAYNNKRYKCAGCIINSDVYQGSGKHWMALFADARDDRGWTVEFFNSSGNNPAPEWVNWMEKTRIAMESVYKGAKKPEIVKVCSVRHQESKSECGLYSLFYIWARLNNVPYSYFNVSHVPDQFMFEFRQHIFDNPAAAVGDKFDWKDYARRVNIKWEKD